MKNILAVLCLSLAAAATALAHHSFAAEFDARKIQTIKGTVTEFQWMNPHAYIYVNAPDASGKIVNWGIQSRNLSILKRQGWAKNTLKVGEEITVEFFHHKEEGKNIGFARYIQKADGTKYDVIPGGEGGIVAPSKP